MERKLHIFIFAAVHDRHHFSPRILNFPERVTRTIFKSSSIASKYYFSKHLNINFVSFKTKKKKNKKEKKILDLCTNK